MFRIEKKNHFGASVKHILKSRQDWTFTKPIEKFEKNLCILDLRRCKLHAKRHAFQTYQTSDGIYDTLAVIVLN